MTLKERSFIRKKKRSQILLRTSRHYARYFKEKHYYTYCKTCNHSKGGICFECDRALQPGVNISLKILDASRGNHGTPDPSAYKSQYAQVKWCRQIKNRSLYNIGAQYFSGKPEF